MDGGSQGEDSTVTDIPLAYVERTAPRLGMDDDALDSLEDPAGFLPGARLIVREGVSSRSVARDVTTPVLGRGHDIRDLTMSFDGGRMLFSARAPQIPDADDDEQPTWNIWEYEFTSGVAKRVISSRVLAEQGQDRYPAYLPDGRIVFASTRQPQTRARMLDEGRPQYYPLEEGRDVRAFALHVMEADGSGVEQITFNASHDVAPLVMADGRILFQRWDNKDSVNRFDLYRVNPDGTAVEPLYGANSHEWVGDLRRQFQPLAMAEDGRVITALRTVESRNLAIQPILVDVGAFVNRDGPLEGVNGGAAEQSLSLSSARPGSVDVAGWLADLAPMNDASGRLLMAWSPCRLDENGTLRPCTEEYLSRGLPGAPPAYGLWVFDPAEAVQRPVVKPRDGIWITELAVATATRLPAQPLLPERETTLADSNLAVLDIRSIYDLDGAFSGFMDPLPAGGESFANFANPARVAPEQRAVRFLRVIKGVPIPGDEVRNIPASQIGRMPAFGMREIVGYVPVQPDGSVRVRVPADAPLGLQLVGADGQSVYGRHGAWITLRPGETLHCKGCHGSSSPLPHGRQQGMAASLNPGAPLTGSPFPNTRSDVVSFADAGETMAQALTRLYPERELPMMDMVAEDVWTDPAPDPATELQLRYTDLETEIPVDPVCLADWQPGCRTIINYPDHIQPIWDLPRNAMVGGVATEVTCTQCHNRRDASNAIQVPLGQLELTGDPAVDQPSQLTSYRELLFDDNEQILLDGALIDRLAIALDDEGNIVYQTDEDGVLVLDINGNPVPLVEPVEISAPVRAGQARNSGRFFSLFAPGGSHHDWLSDEELRLLAEWIDLGAQQYNDPFRVPE
nr:PD40 domain-containing protein [Alcanivorax sp. DP30]